MARRLGIPTYERYSAHQEKAATYHPPGLKDDEPDPAWTTIDLASKLAQEKVVCTNCQRPAWESYVDVAQLAISFLLCAAFSASQIIVVAFSGRKFADLARCSVLGR